MIYNIRIIVHIDCFQSIYCLKISIIWHSFNLTIRYNKKVFIKFIKFFQIPEVFDVVDEADDPEFELLPVEVSIVFSNLINPLLGPVDD
jgi:hypothetical protein